MLKTLSKPSRHGVVGAGLLLLSTSALAATPVLATTPGALVIASMLVPPQATATPSAQVASANPVHTKSQPAVPSDAMPANTLANERGGSETVSNQATLSGVVSNNSATQVTTGANIIQSNSFANASGIPVVIQNSGANVLIQNATVINLQLK